MADDELWHVRVSADEVKTLTLEQIDDLYRLDVIDADTQLWQDGMDEWLPLRVVAGLDEAEVVNISVPPPSAPPPKMSSTIGTWPPPAVARPSAAASSWPPPVSGPGASNSRPPISRPPPPPGEANSRPPNSRPPAPSSRPAPPSSRSAALASTVPSWPPTVGGSTSVPPPAPIGLLSPSYAPPASVRPQVVADPYKYPRPTNPMPIVFAAIIGIVITLYRNDMLYAAAHRVGQESTFLKLEQALGGPGFGTPRAVASMAKAAAALPDIAPLPAPTSTSRSYASSTSDSDSKSSSSSTTTKATATPMATSTPRPETRTVAATKPQPQSQPAPRPVAPRPEAEPTNAVFKQPKGAKKAKGNEFDPLNPSL